MSKTWKTIIGLVWGSIVGLGVFYGLFCLMWLIAPNSFESIREALSIKQVFGLMSLIWSGITSGFSEWSANDWETLALLGPALFTAPVIGLISGIKDDKAKKVFLKPFFAIIVEICVVVVVSIVVLLLSFKEFGIALAVVFVIFAFIAAVNGGGKIWVIFFED